MTEELVRVVLVPKDGGADLASRLQFILDLKVDTESKQCLGPLPAFGRRGDFNRIDSLYPFTLMADGRVDYGAYAAPEDRQSNLDIRSKTIVTGSAVTYKTSGDHSNYVIKSVTALSTKPS